MEWKSGDCELGTMLIDWGNRTVTMQGIDGCCPGMTPEEILAFLEKEKHEEQTDRFAMVCWHEPKQFCLYGMDGFVNEVSAERSEGEKAADTDHS